MERVALLLLSTSCLFQGYKGQPAQCCTRKNVGDVEYSLVDEIDTSGYNCLSSCVFEKADTPGSRFCFASGELPVNCGDGGSSPSTRQIICNYRPKSDVMEHWKIDLDLRDMAAFLANPVDFTKAEGIYQNGANSMKSSEITLNTPLAQAFPAGSIVEQGSNVGQLNKDAAIGASVIKVGIDTPCVSQYGQYPDTSGCFTDDGGSFMIAGVDVGPGTVKLKYRTLQGFSTSANDKMTGKEMFEIYKAYYGVGDYADKFITAALQGTNDDETNVSMDFSGKDDDFRAGCAMKGTAFWSVWLYTIWEMEDAIGDCDADCAEKDCNDAPVHAWDEAWAFYTGSLEGKYGNSAGIFEYRLAEDMSKIFGTDLAGKSKVNRELENAFLDGKDQIDQGNCSGAEAYKKNIMTQMSIPLIQATLNAASTIANGDPSSKAKAAAVSFAGSILPQVAKCSAADAETIKTNLWIDASALTMAGYQAVKGAFENNYACMGVTAGDVGSM